MTMRNLKRLASMFLALALVLSIAGVNYVVGNANADSYDQAKVNLFEDINGHWAKNSLSNLIGYGYMHGIGNNKADPDGKLTTAQLVTLLVRIMGGSQEADLSGYSDVDKGAWYYTYFAQGVNMGIVPNTNSNYLNPNQQSTREYAAYMLCRAFGLTVREPIDDYSDANKVSSWAVTSMQAMVAAKAITGANGNNNSRNLNPQEVITRAEFAEMVYRLCKNFVQPADSSTIRSGTIDGGILISKSGCHLNGVTVKGNVYVSDAVGTGDVTFEDTKVEGNIYVRGSGERSVHLEGTTTANSVVFINPYNATRLVVEDEAKINGVLVNNGVDEVTLEGKVGNVTINVSDVDLTLEKAEADNVIINSARSVVTVEKDSKVNSLTVASSSSGVSVVNKGEMARLALMANNAKLDLDGKVDYLLVGAVSGLDLKLSKDIKLTALDLHCSNSTISLDSEIGSINVSGFSEKLKLEIGKNAKVTAIGISSASTDLAVAAEASVGNVTLDAPKYKGTVSSDLKNLTIGAGAAEAELTLAKDTDIETLTINGNKVKLITVSGCSVKDVNVTGTEVSITGTGAIERVNVSETANKANVETPNTKVSNAGATEVKAGTVDLPANKSYTTTSTGKDVIRNNDGTPDGDGDKTTGAAQEVATVANYTLTYAANATANDIDASGKWRLDDLGTGLTLTKNTTGSGASYKLTGNVKKVENFLPVFDPIAGYGTGYYVPVVLEAESMTKETNYVATSGGVRYTNLNLSKGTGYNGKLIVFLQLQSGTTSKVATVSFDRDGDGKNYSPVTVSIDYSGVTFDGAQDLTGELFSYPVRATAADLTKDSKVELAAFGTFNLVKGSTQAYQVTGNAGYIIDTPNGNTGLSEGSPECHHYLPLMINTSGFANGWTIVVDGSARYGSSNVSSGTGCRGNLVLLLPLYDRTTGGTNNSASHSIYMDTDGDGRVDFGGTYTFDYTNVVLAKQGTNASPEGVTLTLPSAGGEITVSDPNGYFKNFTGVNLKRELYNVVRSTLGDKYNISSTTQDFIDWASNAVFRVTEKSTGKAVEFTLTYDTCLSGSSSGGYITKFVEIPEYVNVAYTVGSTTASVTDTSKDGDFINSDPEKVVVLHKAAEFLASKMHTLGYSKIYITDDPDTERGGYIVYGTFADEEVAVVLVPSDLVHDYKEPAPATAVVHVKVPGTDLQMKDIEVTYEIDKDNPETLKGICDYINKEYRVVWGDYYYAGTPLTENFASVADIASIKVSPDDMYFFGYVKVKTAPKTTQFGGLTATASLSADVFKDQNVFLNSAKTEGYAMLGCAETVTLKISAGKTASNQILTLAVNGATTKLNGTIPDAKTIAGIDNITLAEDGKTLGITTFYDTANEDGENAKDVTDIEIKLDVVVTGEFEILMTVQDYTPPTV